MPKTKATRLNKVKEVAIESFVPGATGVIKSALEGGADIVQALSNVIQKSGKEGLLRSLGQEWETFCESGKAKTDFISTESGNACLQELMDFLDKEMPNKTRFDAMKKLYFRAANVETTEADEVRCLQLMKVCRELDATELLILSVAFSEFTRREKATPREREVTGAEEWPKVLAQVSRGSLSVGLIDYYEERLIEKQIIAGRVHSDRSGIKRSEKFRLAPLGMELGELLEHN